MFWTVRGTLRETQEDVWIVVEAESSEEAHCMGLRKGIPVVIVEPATRGEIREARAAHRLWHYTAQPRLTAFGEPLRQWELLGLMLCGVATIVLLLQVNHVPLRVLGM